VENSDQVVKLCNQVKDGKWLLEITQVNKRSTQQNRYYFGLVIPLVQNGIRDLGTELTKEETHEFLKSRFNYSELVNRDTGQVEHLPRSTTLLNKLAFSEYISKIQQFASEFLNIVIPDPGQQMTIDVD
jgi:hypothetical protein